MVNSVRQRVALFVFALFLLSCFAAGALRYAYQLQGRPPILDVAVTIFGGLASCFLGVLLVYVPPIVRSRDDAVRSAGNSTILRAIVGIIFIVLGVAAIAFGSSRLPGLMR